MSPGAEVEMNGCTLSFGRWTVGMGLVLGAAMGCGTDGDSRGEPVEIPEDGLYAGLIELEQRSFAAGVRVDTKTCSAPLVLQVDLTAQEWFHMAQAHCELGGRDGTVSLHLAVAPGSDATGRPMGWVDGTIPEMTWSGVFRDDGTFTAIAVSEGDGTASREEWTIAVSALSADVAFEQGDTGG